LKIEKQATYDRIDDLILDREDVRHFAIESLGKDMRPCLCVDQLHRGAQALASQPDTAFEDEFRTELPAHLRHVHRLAPVAERGVSGDDGEIPEAAQLGDDVLGEAVGEVVLLCASRHVRERQNGDGGKFPAARKCRLEQCPGRLHSEDPDRRSNVLELHQSEVFHHDGDLASDFIVHLLGHADATRLGQRFQSRCDVDPLAINV